ncbi:MAG TPA: class I SAM-dependent methyltransferase [Puia sp.]|nr:class I SAM-dependent methyltransferase [Puia sp.]
MKKKLIYFLNKLPYIRALYKQISRYEKLNEFDPGSYYSPINDPDFVREYEALIWKDFDPDCLRGINMNINEQIFLLNQSEQYYSEIPFSDNKKDKLRFYYTNGFYEHGDAIILYIFLRYFKPGKIIEVGSGYTSALMLDTRDLSLKNMELIFIEPNPERLFSLITEKDKENTKIFVNKVQDIPFSIFETLNENDILFIDSSHISKAGSDLNHLLFEVLPRLKKGVKIHIHDIFFPFEYPKEWILSGRSWNEDYLIRSFLMFNNEFKIIFFSDFLYKYNPNLFKGMPLSYKKTGYNLWLEKC